VTDPNPAPDSNSHNYCWCVCTETCIDKGTRIPTGLDLSLTYEFGVMTGIQDRNPSDGVADEIEAAARGQIASAAGCSFVEQLTIQITCEAAQSLQCFE
jgi:hypothetical protein